MKKNTSSTRRGPALSVKPLTPTQQRRSRFLARQESQPSRLLSRAQEMTAYGAAVLPAAFTRPAKVQQPEAYLASAWDEPPYPAQPEPAAAEVSVLVPAWDYEAALARQAARRQAQAAEAAAQALLEQARAQAAAEVQAAREQAACAHELEPMPGLSGATPSMVWTAAYGVTLGLGCLAGGGWLVARIAADVFAR